MGPAIAVLGAIVSICCGLLLLRRYFEAQRKLLLWCAFCFLGLALSNLLDFVDLVLVPYADLYRFRLAAAALSMLLLLYGLIWESE
jgi:hypothetical protein